MPPLNVLSLLASVGGAIVILLWRVRETRTPVSTKEHRDSAAGHGDRFLHVHRARLPCAVDLGAWRRSALVPWPPRTPLLATSRLVRTGDEVTMQRSNVFFAVIVVLAGIRIAARAYLDTVLTVPQTAGLFFVLAFGMILRWRAKMLLDFTARSRRSSAHRATLIAACRNQSQRRSASRVSSRRAAKTDVSSG